MNLSYNFYYWGPFLFKTKFTEEEIKKIIFFCNKDKKLDYRNKLAGHISEEYSLNNSDIFSILGPYIEKYIKARYDTMKLPFQARIEIESAWVNYMKEGEFNPPHAHNADLSCVLYLNIPEDMIKNKENHVADSPVPGSIVFKYGENLKNNIYSQNFFPEIGDFYIFPSWLQHYVYPFKSKGERISLSANFNEIMEK